MTHSAQLFFSDRYRRLGTWHAARGGDRRAARLRAKANEHHRAGGDDEPPYAAAMAMPRPRRFVVTNAVSTRRLDRPGSSDDAA